MNMSKRGFSLAVPSFVSNFNSRKSKKKPSKINKLKHFPFKSKLSQVSVIALTN